MKKLVSAVSVWWANVLALLPTSKTRQHVEVLKTELENTQKLVSYWQALYESLVGVHVTHYAENQKLQRQLANKIAELQKTDGWNVELNKDKTRLIAEVNTANAYGLRLESQVARLTASVLELERQREVWVERTEAHRDARREISSVLARLGKKDPMQFPKPKPEEIQPQAISYRTPTGDDLKNGPISVETSEDGIIWHPYYLVAIARNGLFKCQYIRGVGIPIESFQFARIPDHQPTQNDATPNQTH